MICESQIVLQFTATKHPPIIEFIRDEETYKGPYNCNKTTGIVVGNPANASIIQDLKRTIRNQKSVEGGARNHADAMTVDDMKKIIEDSEKLCPFVEGQNIPDDVESILRCASHFEMRALMTTGFTLWTR
jgi:hypothetical protein